MKWNATLIMHTRHAGIFSKNNLENCNFNLESDNIWNALTMDSFQDIGMNNCLSFLSLSQAERKQYMVFFGWSRI